MTRNYKWFLAGFIVFLLIIAIVVFAASDSESVIRPESVKASEVYTFSFASQSGEYGADSDEVYYSDSFFMQSSSVYDHELARVSLALSMTAFKKKYVTEFMGDLGYENIVPYRYDQTGDEDKVALVMGHKKLSVEEGASGGSGNLGSSLFTGNRSRAVIVVAVRGGKYGDEWGSNGRIGYDGESFGYHYGFHKAAEDAIVQLKEYAADNNLSLAESIIWITGFSRGAAVANVMGAMLMGGDLENSRNQVTILPQNLFCYTFASPNTVSESFVTGSVSENINQTAAKQSDVHRGIYNIVNPLDIVTRLPMNASGISKTSKGKTVRYNWDYVKYGTDLYLPTESESAQLQMVQLLENALAFATRNESRYVERTQDQVIIPALKQTMGKGADVSKRNVGLVLIDSLPGVATFLKNEVNQLDFMAQIYVAGILSGQKSIRLEKEHWPETYWGWMVKVDGLE